MWKRVFKQKINSITVAAILVAGSSLVSRVLGIFRDRILAGQFGAGESLDIYYAAFRVPDLLFNLVVLGALSAGFIPVFSSLLKNDNSAENKEAWSLASNVLNFLSIILIIFSAIGFLFADFLVSIIAPGFSIEAKQTTVELTRIMFLSPIFLGISGVLGGILQSFRRFLIYSIAPILYNLGIIAGAVWFSGWFGLPGLAWGVVLGAFMHMVIQIPAVYVLGFKHFWRLSWRDLNTRKIGRLMIPRTISLAIAQVDLLVGTIIASSLVSGSLTVFNLANNLQSFPVGIFGISFAIAAFPVLSRCAFDKKELIRCLSSTMRQILFFVIPATVLLITLRAQIIRVVLGVGAFNWQDTILTMNTLAFFAISLFAQALIPLLVRVFYARQDSKTPLYLGIVSVVLDIVLCWFLSRSMGVAGLALAYSIASITNFIMLILFLYFKIGDIGLAKIASSALKMSVSAIGAGFMVQISKIVIWPFIDMTTFFGVFVQLSVSALTGLIVYALLCYLLGSKELLIFIAALKKKLKIKR